MAQDKEGNKTTGKTQAASGFRNALIIIIAAFLTLAGPTYMVYAFNSILDMDYFTSITSGFIMFIVGLVILFYMIRKKILT